MIITLWNEKERYSVFYRNNNFNFRRLIAFLFLFIGIFFIVFSPFANSVEKEGIWTCVTHGGPVGTIIHSRNLRDPEECPGIAEAAFSGDRRLLVVGKYNESESSIEFEGRYGVLDNWGRWGNYQVSVSSQLLFSCYAPYKVFSEGANWHCSKYCPPEKPDLENGVCTGPEVLQCSAGNPVIISNGTKVQAEAADILTTGAYPIYFARNYNSQGSSEAQELRQQAIQKSLPINKTQWVKHIQPAGYKGDHIGYAAHYIDELINNTRLAGYKSWTHNYFGLLEVLGNTVRLNSSQFADRRFTLQEDGSYQPTNITSDTLTRIEDATGNLLHWVYRSASNQTEHYNAQGQLIRRTNSAGLSHHLAYDVNGNLEVVKDDANNQLLFTYDDKGKLDTLTSSNGSVVTYGYDQVANLETVTKKLVLGKETVRSYHYEDIRHPYALTGITDENGVRYATWEYDELGRAVVSKHAGDTDTTAFEFTTNKTTVTNPLGKQTIYNYNTIAGAKRLETVEGVATASCLGANQNYEYYPDGQLKSKTDWKGIKTEFVYNERGLEIQRTEALGTPEQRITTTTWHATFNLPVTITIGNQVTTFNYDTNGLLTAKSVTKI